MLVINDDGVGVGEKAGAGRGRSNMKARTKELGGEISVTSDKGTTIRVALPLPEKYPVRGMEI
jgi:signal transduction histidine kinase